MRTPPLFTTHAKLNRLITVAGRGISGCFRAKIATPRERGGDIESLHVGLEGSLDLDGQVLGLLGRQSLELDVQAGAEVSNFSLPIDRTGILLIQMKTGNLLI